MNDNKLYKKLPCPRRGKRYVNPHLDHHFRNLWDVILWQIGIYNDKAPPPDRPRDFVYPNPVETLDESRPQVTWIGHSAFCIRFENRVFLTDPIFEKRCSPFKFAGPHRLHPPPMQLEDIETVDVVLISHNHYDHLERQTVRKIREKFPDALWVVPSGLSKWFKRHKISNVIELAWWEEAKLPFKESLKVTATPAQHFSGRGLFDKMKTLWCGFVVESADKSFYFVGDTGYNGIDFKRIGRVFGGFDLSLIPIGTYVPHKFMGPVHINPACAVKIHQEVASKLSIGMHWYTFRLSSEKRMQPPYDLYLSMREANLPPEEFRALMPGQTINF